MENRRSGVKALDRLPLILTERLLIVGVRSLEPRMTETSVDLQGGLPTEAVVEPFDKVFCIAVGVERGQLRRIQKAPAVERIERGEGSEAPRTISKMSADLAGRESATAQGKLSCWPLLIQSRTCLRHDDHAGFVTYIRLRSAFTHLQRLQGVE